MKKLHLYDYLKHCKHIQEKLQYMSKKINCKYIFIMNYFKRITIVYIIFILIFFLVKYYLKKKVNNMESIKYNIIHINTLS